MSHVQTGAADGQPHNADDLFDPDADSAEDVLLDLQDRLLAVARERPATTLILALVSGFILGKLVSRM